MKKNVLIIFCPLLAFFTTHGCKQNSTENFEADKAAIQKIIDEHMKGVETLDLRLILPNVAEDNIEMPANSERLIGKKPYQDYCQHFFDYVKTLKKHEMICTPDEFVVSGDWAFQIGKYTFKLVFPNDSITEDKGNYVWLFKKEANKWKWARVISNSTMPLK